MEVVESAECNSCAGVPKPTRSLPRPSGQPGSRPEETSAQKADNLQILVRVSLSRLTATRSENSSGRGKAVLSGEPAGPSGPRWCAEGRHKGHVLAANDVSPLISNTAVSEHWAERCANGMISFSLSTLVTYRRGKNQADCKPSSSSTGPKSCHPVTLWFRRQSTASVYVNHLVTLINAP